MTKYIFIAFLFILSLAQSEAQKRDNIWVLGYYRGDPLPGDDTIIGVQKIVFKNNQAQVLKSFKWKISIDQVNASISDQEGNLLFFFNGDNLYNKNLELVKGENNINIDTIFNIGGSFLNVGYNMNSPQQGIFLPYPDDENKTILCCKSDMSSKIGGKLHIHAAKFNISIIDNKGSDGLGEVLKRRVTIIRDTLDIGKVIATKHANGRDWWIIVQRYYDNTYYKVLVTPQEIKVTDKQVIGIDKSSFSAQAIFTPDGSKYISFENGVAAGSPHLVIFDFDRCTGRLSNPVNIFLGENEYPGGGAAVSPNGRFLYVTFFSRLLQFDLWATDIPASQKLIANYDGFLFQNTYRTGFYLMQLAPDGKIYMSTSGASPYLHVINKPDLEGEACDFVQRGLKLPYVNAWSIPNHPNYRLGALKGSPCDTLGLGVATKDIEKEGNIKIYPNPATESISIFVADESLQDIDFQLFNLQGALLKKQQINSTLQAIDISDLANGMYLVEIRQEGKRLKKEKIVVLRE